MNSLVRAAGDVQQTVGRHVAAQAGHQLRRLRVAAERRRRGTGRRRPAPSRAVPHPARGRPRGSARWPAPATDGAATAGIVLGDPVGRRRHHRGDLQRRLRASARRPERRDAAGSGTGSAKGSPPSGRDTAASQSQSSTARGAVAGARSANSLQGVQGATGLAGARAQVRLQAPAVAPVAVAVRVDGGEHRCGVAVPEEQVEPTAVQDAGGARQEVRRGGQIDARCHPQGDGQLENGARVLQPSAVELAQLPHAVADGLRVHEQLGGDLLPATVVQQPRRAASPPASRGRASVRSPSGASTAARRSASASPSARSTRSASRLSVSSALGPLRRRGPAASARTARA